MAATPRLSLPFLSVGQAQKEFTHNESLQTLDALVAGALILYPTYMSRTTGHFTTPERAVEELVEWRDRRTELPVWRRVLRPLWLLGDSWRRRLIELPEQIRT